MKKNLWFVLSLTIIVSVIAGCMPNYIEPVKLPTTLIDPVIAVDPEGNSHIAGVSEDRVHYMRLNKNGVVERTEILEISNISVKQSKPDIAVTDDGTAWLVWYETWGDVTEACHTSIPISGSFDPMCQELISPSTGIVRVAARVNQVYAVFDERSFFSDKIVKLSYKNLKTDEFGTVYDYKSPEEGTIHGINIAIDSDGHLHVVYIDQGSDTGDPRFRYRSNVTTEDNIMTRKWDIFENPNLRTDVDPKISYHYFKPNTESVIMSSAFKPETVNIIIASCEVDSCFIKSYWGVPDTQNMEITDVDILGYEEPSGFAVSFIGKKSSETHPQVYSWTSNVLDITQITNSATNKSNLSMVYGFIPVLGFLEYVIIYQPPYFIPFETIKVREYDWENGLRTIFETGGPPDDKRKLDLSANLNLPKGTVPVAGVWYVCGETWFSINERYKIFLPMIHR